MNLESIRALVDESKDAVSCAQNMLQIFDIEISNLDVLSLKHWIYLRLALKEASDLTKTTQRSVEELDKSFPLVPRIPEEQMQAQRSKVERQRAIFMSKYSQLQELEEESRRRIETFNKTFRDESEKFADRIHARAELIATVESRIQKLATEDRGIEAGEDSPIPVVIVDSISSPPGYREFGGSTLHNLLRVPESGEGDSRESGISEGFSSQSGFHTANAGSFNRDPEA